MAASGGGSSSSSPPFPLLLRWGLAAAAAAALALLARPCGAGLYEEAAAGADPAVWVLAAGTARRALRDSPSAWLVQFYSSACGHCVAFAPLWRALAGDVHEWEPAIRIGVLDCGDEENYEACKDYRIQFYPTFRYFRAFTKQFTTGESQHGSDRELQTIRQTMVDFLQNHSRETKPPACPPLEPVEPEEIFSLFDKSSQHYTAIIFESANSYVGREVILDMIQYENIVVKRALDSETAFLEKLSIASVPSSYLIYPNGSHGLINILKPLRSVFSSYLKSLPGVRRRRLSSSQLPVPVREGSRDVEEWKDYDKSKLYMADLESGLHYLLRVELATHQTLEGAELRTFKEFVAVLAKLFPGRQPLLKLLETLQVWLVSLPLDKIPYDAILDLLNNKMRISGLFLTSRVQWVGCQGSRPELRGYTCSFWKLFHTLTVQAAVRPKALLNTGLEGNPRAVLEILQKYIQDFFGCRACAQHFEEMARESLARVQSLDEAVLWLWEKHNVVNARLAGDLSEDPKFPKVQWPTPDLCPACHEENKGLHTWNKAQVLQFLKQHYGSGNLVHPYTEGPADLEEGELPGARGEDAPYKKPSRRNEDKVPDPDKQRDPEWRVLDQLSAKDSPSKDPGQMAAESIRGEEVVKQAVSFLGFSNIDMSLCVVLYMTSSLFLMILYFFFRMRSKRWKVRHYRPYV
ncbi:sulfhydryl oxidase 2 isoform X2 [Hemicordylus capensis]|uniref:sulfhydryl oxidase 2 isoform X2 n=1 Tax=Hemicordylus capensis TaxID=884348 RepID=UPI002303C715|nr:sulfhydryl oxidase 2 isoform X2 [Hemicordylus capensis]